MAFPTTICWAIIFITKIRFATGASIAVIPRMALNIKKKQFVFSIWFKFPSIRNSLPLSYTMKFDDLFQDKLLFNGLLNLLL